MGKYAKFLWGCIAVTAICLIVAGFGFLGEGHKNLIEGSLIVILAIWAIMGISVWVVGIRDMKKK